MHPASPSARLRGARELDDIDVQLVELLTIDGRTSIRHLAQRVGVTETTVLARLRSLMGRSILRVRAVVDWQRAGYASPMAIFIRVPGRPLSEVIGELSFTSEVQSVSRVFGSVDLIARILIAKPDDAARYVDETIARIAGAETVMTLLEIETLKYLNTFHTVDLPSREITAFPSPPFPLDDLDMAIIGRLVDDARQPWRLIAESLDAPESTVRARARRIEDSGLIKVMAQIDPVTAGLPVRLAWIGLQVSGAELHRTLGLAAQRAEISIVMRTVGRFDMLLFAAVASRQGLADLLDHLRGLQGVTSSETWSVSTMTVPAFPWGLIEQGPMAAEE